MREHIFKAKRFDDKEWVQGYYVVLKDSYKNRISYRIYKGDAESEFVGYNEINFYADWWEVDLNTVCEFTGVTDKNDKMIFEGDIIQNRRFNEIFYVYWNEEGLFWELVDTTSNIHHQLNEINIEAAWGDTPSYEIIGNIHD
jgi:uncharacterized phage protein (TIGR01671 family)